MNWVCRKPEHSSSPRGKGWLRNSGKAEEIKRKRSRWLKWTHSIWPGLNDWVALWSCPAAAWVPWMHHHQQVSEQRQVNSAQLHPVPRWIKGKNTDTPTCQKGEQVGKQREKKKKTTGPNSLVVGWDVFPVCCFTALAWVRLATCLLPPLNAERSTKINSVVLQLIWHVDVSWGPSEKSLRVWTVHQPESSGNTAWIITLNWITCWAF